MIRINFISVLILTFISVFAFAQDNNIKLGFSDAFLGHLNLSYEKMVSEKNTLQVKIGYWQPTISPFIDDQTISPEAFTLKESNGGLNTSVEYRFYMSGNSTPTGIYLAPYLRYFSQSALFSDQIDGKAFDVDTRLNTVGVGAQIGYQLIINEIFTFDFYFFGAGIDHHNLKMVYQLQQPQAGFDYRSITDDVSEVFEDINCLESKLKHKVSDKNLTSKLPFLFPGFRIGVSVGVAF
jgi:hypothetical protein